MISRYNTATISSCEVEGTGTKRQASNIQPVGNVTLRIGIDTDNESNVMFGDSVRLYYDGLIYPDMLNYKPLYSNAACIAPPRSGYTPEFDGAIFIGNYINTSISDFAVIRSAAFAEPELPTDPPTSNPSTNRTGMSTITKYFLVSSDFSNESYYYVGFQFTTSRKWAWSGTEQKYSWADGFYYYSMGGGVSSSVIIFSKNGSYMSTGNGFYPFGNDVISTSPNIYYQNYNLCFIYPTSSTPRLAISYFHTTSGSSLSRYSYTCTTRNTAIDAANNIVYNNLLQYNQIAYNTGEHIDVLGPDSAAPATNVKLSVMPDSNYEIDNLVIESESGNVNYTIAEATSGYTVTFTMPSVDVTVTATAKWVKNWSIVKRPGAHTAINCQDTGATNEEITFTVDVEDNYRLQNIYIYCEQELVKYSVSGPGSYTFTMPDGVAIIETYAYLAEAHSIITAGTNCTVSSNHETATESTVVTITVTPNENYVITSFQVETMTGRPLDFNLVKHDGYINYLFTMPNENVRAFATAELAAAQTCAVSVVDGIGYKIICNSAGLDVPRKETVTFSVQLDEGYNLGDVLCRLDGALKAPKKTESGWSISADGETLVISARVSKGDTTSGTGGTGGAGGAGGGTYDNNSDNITTPGLGDTPALPPNLAANAGLISIFAPTSSQLTALANYLWTDNVLETISNTVGRLFTNPMDLIISLQLMPVNPSIGGVRELKFGPALKSGVEAQYCTNQFTTVNCGSFDLKEYYGSFLDYSPYTRLQLYLPYIGFIELDTDECMNRTLSVSYTIDLVTGNCIAFISANGIVLYQHTGNCSSSIPLTSADYSNIISGVLMAAAGGAMLMSGAGASMGALTMAKSVQNVSGAASQALSAMARPRGQNGRFVSPNSVPGLSQARGALEGLQDTADKLQEQAEKVLSSSSYGAQAAASLRGTAYTVGHVLTAKQQIQRSGSMTGGSGLMGIQYPYIVITRPNVSMPENYNYLFGKPSNIYMPLSECSGYTEVEQCVINAQGITDEELADLYSILKGGVYL